jgi:hypothetical protein
MLRNRLGQGPQSDFPRYPAPDREHVDLDLTHAAAVGIEVDGEAVTGRGNRPSCAITSPPRVS